MTTHSQSSGCKYGARWLAALAACALLQGCANSHFGGGGYTAYSAAGTQSYTTYSNYGYYPYWARARGFGPAYHPAYYAGFYPGWSIDYWYYGGWAFSPAAYWPPSWYYFHRHGSYFAGSGYRHGFGPGYAFYSSRFYPWHGYWPGPGWYPWTHGSNAFHPYSVAPYHPPGAAQGPANETVPTYQVPPRHRGDPDQWRGDQAENRAYRQGRDTGELARSVTVRPNPAGSPGERGMVVTSRADRKIAPSKLHPAAPVNTTPADRSARNAWPAPSPRNDPGRLQPPARIASPAVPARPEPARPAFEPAPRANYRPPQDSRVPSPRREDRHSFRGNRGQERTDDQH